MKKQFSKIWVCLTVMLAVFAIPAMAVSDPVAEFTKSYMECGKTHCVVCDMNGRCHIVKKQKKSNFLDMPTPDVKVAKYIWDCSGSGTHCKICTKNGSKCIYKKKKTAGGTYAKLKCKKAKTCKIIVDKNRRNIA
jgi:hypothetical protein